MQKEDEMVCIRTATVALLKQVEEIVLGLIVGLVLAPSGFEPELKKWFQWITEVEPLRFKRGTETSNPSVSITQK